MCSLSIYVRMFILHHPKGITSALYLCSLVIIKPTIIIIDMKIMIQMFKSTYHFVTDFSLKLHCIPHIVSQTAK